jgi:hypothetical protein
MFRNPRAALAIALLVGVSGCIAGAQSNNGSTLQPETSGSEPGQAGSPSEPQQAAPADPHGDVQRTDSAVTTWQDTTMVWHAAKTVTLVNGVAGFDTASVSASLASGPVTLRGVPAGSYTATVGLEARSLTEQLARDELDRLTVEHSDTIQDSRLVLSTTVKHAPLASVPLPTGGTLSVDLLGDWNATIDEALPAQLTYDADASTASGSVLASGLTCGKLDLSSASGTVGALDMVAQEAHAGTASGAISIANLRGGTLEASAASGAIDVSTVNVDTLDVGASSGSVAVGQSVAPTLHASTSSGSIQVEGTFDNVDVGTASGAIDLSATPAASGIYNLDASSGSLNAVLGRGAGQAYDIDASTASGSISLSLSDGATQDDGRHHQTARSDGFDDAPIQTTVKLGTSSGSIDVSG